MDSQQESPDAVAALVAGYGAHARPVREVLAALTDQPWSLAALIQVTAVPRRTVEEVIAALGDDVSADPEALAIVPALRDAYRQRFGYAQLRRTAVVDPLAARLDTATELRAELARLVAAAPRSRRALDHVAATPETAAWRGLWLDAQYDLAGAHLLCVGDHDLTSLAATLVNPEAAVTVVDLDERILEFIDTQARKLGLDVRCRYADLRHGLPAGVTASADLVFTDPPYTPEGVRLFLARGAEGLRDRDRGRLVMAYGFSDRTPALGLKVQQSAQELALTFEAILPAVQRYDGAQAVGSASDLYICRPTARTWKALDRVVENAVNIYTHGPQSLEGAAAGLDAQVVAAVVEAVGAPVTAMVGSSWPVDQDGPARVGLETLLAGGLPPVATVRGATTAAVDLSADPGPWLLRVLLAANADRLAMLVPNGHPDLTSESSQRALTELVSAKYRLRFRRSTPGPDHAIVVAESVPLGSLAPDARLTRGALDRAHGRIGNVWREGLIAASRRAATPPAAQLPAGQAPAAASPAVTPPTGQAPATTPLTKNDARRAVRAATSRPEGLDASAIELPRHQLAELLAELRASAP